MAITIDHNNKNYKTAVNEMIGKRIRETREKNGLTQSALAKKLGISRSAVNAWELGVSVPSAQYLVELSRLFKVSTDYLLGLISSELVDISDFDDEEKRMIYSLLEYFRKYGRTMRNIARQVETDYSRVREESERLPEGAVKEIMDELVSIRDLLE